MDYASVELHFGKGDSIELLKTVFKPPSGRQTIIGIRGNNSPPGVFSFRWTPTSHALSIFFLRACLGDDHEDRAEPILEGYRACPTASIVRLLHKRMEGWILDLFGCDVQGRSLLTKIILSCNYLGKRPGPAQLFLRSNYLPRQNIRVFLDGKEITGERRILERLTAELERSWKPGVWPAKLGLVPPAAMVGKRAPMALSVINGE